MKPGKPGPPGQCPDPECEAPGEDIDEDEPVVVTGTYHIIDCVGAPDAGNTVEGLFHAEHVCDPKFDRVSIHVLRAGNFNPSTHVHYFGNIGVNAQIADHKDSFEWRKHITIVEGIDPILVNWAILTSDYFDDDGTITIRGGGMAGFDRLHRHQEDLPFSIDGSAGVVDVESNDGDAFKVRGEGLRPGKARGGPPGPPHNHIQPVRLLAAPARRGRHSGGRVT